MCQIVYAPNKKLLIMEDLEVSQENNSDGFGITYAKDDSLFYCRKMADFAIFKQALELVPDDVPLVIHFRTTTYGETSKLNAHPFEILNKMDGDPIDLCIAHNGSIGSIHTHGDKKSDTHLYVEKILRPILKKSPDLIFEPALQLLVKRDIGYNNKFIFLRGDGSVAWVNKDAGYVPKGCSELWYANEYSLKSFYRANKRGSNNTSLEERWQAKYPNLARSMGMGRHANVGSGDVTNGEKELIHTKTKYFTLSELETNVPKEIRDYMKEGEELLINKHIDKVSLQGYGWVKWGKNLARWDKNIAPIHKRWKIEIDPELRKELNITLPGDKTTTQPSEIKSVTEVAPVVIAPVQFGFDLNRNLEKEFERNYDSANLRLLNEPETLNWVLEFPEEAAEWAAKNGFFGSSKKILEWMQDANGNIDCVVDFIFKMSRKRLNVKTLAEIEEERERKKA